MPSPSEDAPLWAALRQRLQDRLTMARQVLDQEGYTSMPPLVPIEDVLIWMDELVAERLLSGPSPGDSAPPAPRRCVNPCHLEYETPRGPQPCRHCEDEGRFGP